MENEMRRACLIIPYLFMIDGEKTQHCSKHSTGSQKMPKATHMIGYKISVV